MSHSADEWYAIGDRALRVGSITEAKQAYDSALSANPSHGNAMYRLAEIARANGDVAGAVALLQRTLSVHPAHAGAKKLLAKLQPAGSTKPAPDPPNCPPSGAGIAGVVESVRRGAEPYDIRSGSATVLAFRLRTQPGGPDQKPQIIAGELRGKLIRGSIDPGDWIELPAGWRPGTSLTRVMNLTTCSEVVGYRRLPPTIVTYAIVGFVSVSIAVLFFVVGRKLFFSGS